MRSRKTRGLGGPWWVAACARLVVVALIGCEAPHEPDAPEPLTKRWETPPWEPPTSEPEPFPGPPREPGQPTPRVVVSEHGYGSVPAFVLYDDDTFVWHDGARPWPRMRQFRGRVSPEEADAIHQRFVDAHIERVPRSFSLNPNVVDGAGISFYVHTPAGWVSMHCGLLPRVERATHLLPRDEVPFDLRNRGLDYVNRPPEPMLAANDAFLALDVSAVEPLEGERPAAAFLAALPRLDQCNRGGRGKHEGGPQEDRYLCPRERVQPLERP